jgi:hypothetical protein
MDHLILESDGITYPLIGLLGESNPGVILTDTGTGGLVVDGPGVTPNDKQASRFATG